MGRIFLVDCSVSVLAIRVKYSTIVPDNCTFCNLLFCVLKTEGYKYETVEVTMGTRNSGMGIFYPGGKSR
jgi:hypothetical protein